MLKWVRLGSLVCIGASIGISCHSHTRVHQSSHTTWKKVENVTIETSECMETSGQRLRHANEQ